jgi:hypothetical protein
MTASASRDMMENSGMRLNKLWDTSGIVMMTPTKYILDSTSSDFTTDYVMGRKIAQGD